MTTILGRLSDRLLSLMVPKTQAAAGCVADPLTYWRLCRCDATCCYYRLCRQYSNCEVVCNQFCDIVWC